MKGTLSDISWSEPYKIKTKYGEEYRREWKIPSQIVSNFFEYWRKNSFSLKNDGYGVVKKQNDWYVTETHMELYDFCEFAHTKPIKKDDDFVLLPVDVTIKDGLREWQIQSVGRLLASLKKWNGAIDGSEMGVGKTYQAIGLARELGVHFVVVCPKAVISQWKNVIDNHFKLKNKCLGVVNYEQLTRGKTESEIASYVKRQKTHRKEFVWKLSKNSLIIWDEAQRLKNHKTKNSKCCIEANKAGYPQVFLSASVATNPLELRTIGICLGIYANQKEYFKFLYNNGCTKGRWGWQFDNNKETLKNIHKMLFEQRGVRLRRDSIPNFPECEIEVEPYDLDSESTEKINEIYEEMHLELKKIDKKIKSDGDSELTVRLRARQSTELIKVPLIQEITEECIENGMSVIIFLNFSESIDALAERLSTKCIFDGRISNTIREKNKDDFQANKERVIIINSAAGGVGLSLGDVTGDHPRVSIVSPDDSAFKMKQVQGRSVRENSKSKSIIKFVFISKTIEEQVSNNVKQKLANMDLINDSDLKL